MLTLASVNVNGIRAAARRGMGSWLAARRPQVLCLQEVRAPDDALVEALGGGWHVVHEEGEARGRAGVAVASRIPPEAVRVGLSAPEGVRTAGRWVELDVAVHLGDPAQSRLLTVVSTYVHTGEAGTPRQDEKYAFLDAMRARMLELTAAGHLVVVTGDLNVAHREADLKNWKGNLRKSGFLPQERAFFDGLLGADGFVDVHRSLAGEGPGPYTWYSWRGRAWDTDAGWRIDYQLADAELAACAVKAEVDRAPSYDERWSDHSPVVVEYDLQTAQV